jgi:hypothetical protein
VDVKTNALKYMIDILKLTGLYAETYRMLINVVTVIKSKL